MTRWLVAVLGALAVSASATAWACPACASTAGATNLASDDDDSREVRASLDVTTETESVGSGPFATTIREWRTALGVAVDATPRIALALRVPWVSRSATLDDDGIELARAAHIGDVDTLMAWRAPLEGRSSLQVLAGVRWPTGPRVRDASGQPVMVDVQVGSGSITPSLGLRFATDTARAWHLDASLVALQPLPSRYDWRTGRSLQARVEAGWRTTSWLELAPGLAARHDARARIDGELDDDTGGTVLAATARVRAVHSSGLFTEAGVDVPLATALYGEQERGIRGLISVGAVLAPGADSPPARDPLLMARSDR